MCSWRGWGWSPTSRTRFTHPVLRTSRDSKLNFLSPFYSPPFFGSISYALSQLFSFLSVGEYLWILSNLEHCRRKSHVSSRGSNLCYPENHWWWRANGRRARVKGGCHSGLKGEFPRRVSEDGRNSRPRSRGYGKEFASLLNRFSHCMGSRYQLERDAIGSRHVLWMSS